MNSVHFQQIIILVKRLEASNNRHQKEYMWKETVKIAPYGPLPAFQNSYPFHLRVLLDIIISF